MDNVILRKRYSKVQYVVLTNVRGIDEYVAKGFLRRWEFDYTVTLNKALRFDKKELATRFMEEKGIKGHVLGVVYSLEII